MCNLSKGIMEKGRQIALKACVLALIESTHISVENAMDMLKITKEDRAALQVCLGK